MRIGHFGIASLGIAGALAPAPPAPAAIVTVTYSGVTDGFDETGLFWAPGHFSGAYSVAFRFDTALGTTLTTPTHSSAIGGRFFGVTSPSLGTVLTMNGVSRAFGGDYYAAIEGYNDGTSSYQAHESVFDYFDGINYQSDAFKFELHDSGGRLPAAIDLPFIYRVRSAEDFALATFSLTRYDGIAKANIYRVSAEGTIDMLTYRVDGVPEPASWALFVTGFAVLGGSLRQQRRLTASRAT